jgi:SpoVK/Ycf46/Vps4 family AAA+-type ATPase
MEDFDIKCYLSDDPNKINKCRESCYNIPKYFLNKIAIALGLEPRNTPAETCILIDDWAKQVKLNLLTQPEDKVPELIKKIETDFIEKLENLSDVEDHKTTKIKFDTKPVLTRDKKLKSRKFFGDLFKDQVGLDSKCKNPLKIEDYSFDEIVGMESVKNQLMSEFIYPSKYTNLFHTTSKGILLYGPPGTGKSSIAKAVAAEFKDVAFFEYTAADIIDMYQGQTEKNLEAIWKCAKDAIKSGKFKQSIIFIDEFESIGSTRKDAKSGSSTTSTVPTLLRLTAGLESSNDIALFVATNYLNKLDSALVRRFKTRLFLDHPDWASRKQLILNKLSQVFNFDTILSKERKVRLTKDGKLNRETGGNFAELISVFSMVEPDYIDAIANTIADLTGPSEEGLVKIGKVTYKTSPLTFLFGRIRDTTDPNEKGIGLSKYGYSAGDIGVLCDNVINHAAQRALCESPSYEGGYIQCNHVLANGDIKTYLVYTHYKTKTGYILDPKEYFNTLKSLVKNQGGEVYSDKLVLKLKHNERLEITDTVIENGKCYIDFKNNYLAQGKNVQERVRNFSIFLEDFKNALKTNKPAISNEEYESYLEDKSK